METIFLIEEAKLPKGLPAFDSKISEFFNAKIEPLISPALSCLLYTSPSPRDRTRSRMPSSA